MRRRGTGEPPARPSVERLQLLLAVGVVVVLPWLIAPGRTQPDTKIDLTVSPWRYLGRALQAWNDHAGLGELQNQAYGYLFPMGPLFGVCRSLGIPAWAAQRIWWTVLLVVAFVGTQRLIRRLGVAGQVPAIVGAAAYTLAPRVVTVLPVISAEAWPSALAPWLVLAALPLTRAGASRAEVVRAAALSGVLTACLGGVNATASAIVLVVPAAVLLTDRLGRRRSPVWLAAVLLGAAWWLLPLLVLGHYAYPFLDFIETASITTAVTSVPNVLRGTDDWIAYILDGRGHPVWQGGWVLAQSLTAILATGLVAALGCAGLLTRRGHLARWTIGCVVGAVLFMATAHAGPVGSPLAGSVRSLLDGPLAPLRNVHKADPVLRLPLAIGLAALLQRLCASTRRRHVAAPAAIALAVLVAATPIWQGRAGAQDAYARIPGQWTSVARAVDAAAERSGGSTLLLPNGRTSSYSWGTTTDEPLSALATSPVVTRAAAPLGIPAATRILDTTDALAASGVRQPALAAGLARLGIARVVVRRDLASAVRARPWQRVVRTLRASPGFRPVATYGGGHGALTVYDVTAPAGRGATVYAGPAVTVAGGPEAVFALLATGLLPEGRRMQLVAERAAHAQVVTDTMPWRAYNNGVPTQLAYSPALERSDPLPTRIGARDLPPAGHPADQPARVWTGWSAVRVSSSAADPFAAHFRSVRDGPAAAVDGDPATAWLSGDHGHSAWLAGDLGGRPVPRLRLRLAGPRQHATLPDRVTVQAAGRRVTVPVHGRRTLTIPVHVPFAHGVRVELHAPAGAHDPVLGIAELGIPGTRLGSVVDIPQRIDPATQRLLLTRYAEDGPRLQRRVTLTTSARWPVTVWLRRSGDHAVPHGCGGAGVVRLSGPGGAVVRIPLRATRAAPTGGLVPAVGCGGGAVQAGGSTVVVTGSPGLRPELARFGTAQHPARTRPVLRVTGSAGQRTIRLGAGPGDVVALSEGDNSGWRATAGGQRLSPVLVDGWRQGFRVTGDGPRTVRMRYAPTTPQRAGLLAGVLAAAALLAGYLLAAGAVRRRPEPRGSDGAHAAKPAHPGHAWRSRAAGAVGAAVFGVLVAGPAGLLCAVPAVAAPRRLQGALAAGSLVAACGALAVLGAADARSAGGVAGQLLATVTGCVLVRALFETGGAPTAAPAPPAAPRTPTRSAR